MSKTVHTDPNLFGVIGIGRFGYTLASELVRAGKQVIAIDIDDAKLQQLKDQVTFLYQITQLNKDTLLEADISRCSTVVVCIGKDVESNLLATLNAIDLGVPRVISKAISDDHGRILEKIGAEVVYPEEEMGIRLAKSLSNKMTLDFLALCEDFSIIEVELPVAFDGKTILECDFRHKFGVNVIAVIHNNATNGTIEPTTTVYQGDQLIVAGNNENIDAFQKAIAKKA